jgi:hypothetical protein
MPANDFNTAAKAKNPLNDELIEAISQYGCDRVKVFGLMMKGADTSARGSKPGEEGWTPLMYAITRNNEEALKVLLHYSTNPNVQNDEGDTALHVAIKNYKGFDTFRLARQMIREYEEDGYIDLNIQNKKGQTALMLAAQAGCLDFVERLIVTDAGTFMRDNDGKWALDYARMQANPESYEGKEILRRFEEFDAKYRASLEQGLPSEKDVQVKKPIAFKRNPATS